MSLKACSCGDGPWRRIRDVSDCRGWSEMQEKRVSKAMTVSNASVTEAMSQWLARKMNPAVGLSM